MPPFDAIILGAGAAGCMAAFQAGRRGKKVLVLDHAPTLGKKILISGGGRCNFTNRHARAEDFLSANPDFCRSVLARFTPADTEAWISGAGIPYHEKKLGQLFCDRSARDIVDLLEKELNEAGAEVKLGVKVVQVEPGGDGKARFTVETSAGPFQAVSLVIATGGLSYATLGASDLGLRVAKEFGLRVMPTAPALDGFVFGAEDAKKFDGLQGLSLEAELSTGEESFSEALLFTHRGLSGPAALQASLYWRPGQHVQADLWPGEDAAAALLAFKRREPTARLADFLATRWPRRLAGHWEERQAQAAEPLARYSDAKLRAFAQGVQHWVFLPAGTVGYHKAEVTRGGVDTRELEQKDLQASNVSGLHFCGEVVDVTGRLGGFNFQWAWASGAAVGRHL